MTTVDIRELKNRLNDFLGLVKTGERVVVTDRGRPIAVISPPADAEGDGRIDAMGSAVTRARLDAAASREGLGLLRNGSA